MKILVAEDDENSSITRAMTLSPLLTGLRR